MTDWSLHLLDILERLAPVLGTAMSIILMWRRAGKKQVNGLAGRLAKQEAELTKLRADLATCEDARTRLLQHIFDRIDKGPSP